MSKTVRILAELEKEVRGRPVNNGMCRSVPSGMSITSKDLREMLTRTTAIRQGSIPESLNWYLEEFERLEKELLELQEEERMVLLRMKQILKGSSTLKRKSESNEPLVFPTD